MAKTTENKVLTENPLLDEIVWNAKTLARGVVLKDQTEADKYETLETVQSGDLLIAIEQHGITFERFIYTTELLKKVPGITNEQIVSWAEDNSLIPDYLRPTLTNVASNEFLNNFVEKNNYYRRLHGEPAYDESGEWQGLWIDVNTISESNSNPSLSMQYMDTEGTKYQLIHKLSIGYIEILYDNGTIDNITTNETLLSNLGLNKYDVMYLNHIGSKSIEYYDARRADRFEMLYCPSADSIEVENRFKDLLEANRLVTLYTIYSEAYKFQSEYYDRFMMIMIIIQTIVDMIVELPEYIIRRDVFDLRTCEYIFESNGVDYFPNIPIKYQVALIKNLNKLIKFKSTDKCIVDICSIFGVDSIEVFKYYILKSRKVSSVTDLKYYDETKEVTDTAGNTTIESDNEKNYDINFVKVPILEPYDNYIRSSKNIYDYDSLTNSDDYWIGDKEIDSVRKEIEDMDFTLLRSKYYSIEAVIDIAKKTFELTYFTNAIMYNGIDKSRLVISLPNISNKKKFEIIDVIITLYALSYIYYGAEDDIMNTQGKILQVLGFNMDADLKTIGEYLFETHGVTLKDLKVDGFMIPDDNQMLTFKQLELIYTTNKDIYDHVVYELTRPMRKETYDAYKYIYDSLFIMKLNMEYFSIPSTGEIATTYTDFLAYKEPLLSSYLMSIKAITDVDRRQATCIDAIQQITTYLKDYIDNDVVDLDNIFSGLPSISMDFIKTYIQEVVDFFKSFKIFIHDMAITYIFQDKFQNTMLMIDWMLLKFIFDKSEVIKIEDWIAKNYISMDKCEKIEYVDKLWMSIDTWIQKNYGDYYNKDLYSALTKIIRDSKEYFSHFDSHEQGFEDIYDKFYQMIVTMTISSIYHMDDKIVEKLYTMDKDEFFSDQIQDLINQMTIDVEYHQGFRPNDDNLITTLIDKATRSASGRERINKSTLLFDDLSSSYRPIDNYYIILTSET